MCLLPLQIVVHYHIFVVATHLDTPYTMIAYSIACYPSDIIMVFYIISNF